MTDREKVIRGLECCTNAEKDCDKCPIGLDFGCGLKLKADALALLKAQEPRVMTYDELATFDGAFLIELFDISQLDWVFFFDTDTKSDAIWVEGFDGERYAVYREDYGTYTRCWIYRPDEKMRAETPWDAQEQRDYEAAVEMAEYCERYEPTYNADDGSM